MPALGPYSRPSVLAKLDGRTREARLLAEVRADLTAHVGGSPSATQRRMIERCAWLSLWVAQLDAKAIEGGGLTDHDHRTYLAWSAALTRMLRQLGWKGASAKRPSLAEHLAARAGAAA
jgi:hypothetical protein